MSINFVLRFFGIGQKRSQDSPRRRGRTTRSPVTGSFILPVYGRVPSGSPPSSPSLQPTMDPSKGTSTTTVAGTLDEIDFLDETEGDSALVCHLLHGEEQQQEKGNHGTWKLSLSSFLANFTLGYADGLTVPFALTAGLSWLDSSHLVITAGWAEICAGCISMGIGGYLAAKGVRNSAAKELAMAAAAATAAQIECARNPSSTEEGREWGQTGGQDEEGEERHYALVAKYLAPLNLPSHMLAIVMAHATSAASGSSRSIVATAVKIANSSSSPSKEDSSENDSAEASPIMAGLAVGFGYLVGGLLPLFPYFFVDEVKQGLVWSFIVCLVALFGFGFLKEFVMCAADVPLLSQGDYDDYYGIAWDATAISTRGLSWWRQWVHRARNVPSEDVRASLWGGAVMAGLGGFAAVAAVFFVMVSQLGVKGPEPSPP